MRLEEWDFLDQISFPRKTNFLGYWKEIANPGPAWTYPETESITYFWEKYVHPNYKIQRWNGEMEKCCFLLEIVKMATPATFHCFYHRFQIVYQPFCPYFKLKYFIKALFNWRISHGLTFMCNFTYCWVRQGEELQSD